jgi:cell division septal protein FtsQ
MPNHKYTKTIPTISNRFKLISLFSLITVLLFSFLVGNFIFRFLEETNFFDIFYLEIINRSALDNVSAKYFYDLIEPKTSIFKINLVQIKEKIESDFPCLEKVIITKRFPNRLIFNLVSRHILAQVCLGKKRYFDIDSHGFVLANAHSEITPELPLILGINEEWRLIKPNQKTTSARLLSSLSFIKEYKENNWLPNEHLVALDLSNNYSLNLFLERNLEIRILRNELKPKIKILEGLLKEIRLNNPEVKCIDLRFKDVIINPKE